MTTEPTLGDRLAEIKGANRKELLLSDPSRDRVQEMFEHLELAVCCELFMSETALECDIVLPETSFYEQAEIRQGMWLGPEVVLCQPAVAPVGESKAPYEIVKGIAEKMGWGQHFPYEKWEDWGELMMKDVPMSVEELKAKGFWAGEVRYNRVPEGMPTPSGKTEIFSKAYADAGFEPYPVYSDRSVMPDKDYPLQVLFSTRSGNSALDLLVLEETPGTAVGAASAAKPLTSGNIAIAAEAAPSVREIFAPVPP